MKESSVSDTTFNTDGSSIDRGGGGCRGLKYSDLILCFQDGYKDQKISCYLLVQNNNDDDDEKKNSNGNSNNYNCQNHT